MSSYCSRQCSNDEVLETHEATRICREYSTLLEWSQLKTRQALTSIYSIAKSRPYRFVVGPKREAYFLHPKLVSLHSGYLGALIDADWSGERTACIVLDDVREDTFASVAEYLYTGDYTSASYRVTVIEDDSGDLDSDMIVTPPTTVDGHDADSRLRSAQKSGQAKTALAERPITQGVWEFSGPNHSPVEKSKEKDVSDWDESNPELMTKESPVSPVVDLDEWASYTMKSMKVKAKKRAAMWAEPEPTLEPEADELFTTPGLRACSPINETSEARHITPSAAKPTREAAMWTAFTARQYELEHRPTPVAVRANLNADEGYDVVFLSHARIFMCAKAWFIEGLAKLALKRLHETLTSFTLYSERVGDVVKLVEYAYSRSCMGCVGVLDLRDLVMHYAACKIARLVSDQRFQGVLQAENTAGVDLVKELVEDLV